MNIHRQIIKATDIQIYFGKSQNMSNKMLRQMRKALGKQTFQPITIKEFCAYYRIEEESIIKVILSQHPNTTQNPSHLQSEPTKNESPSTTSKNNNKETQPYKFQSRGW